MKKITALLSILTVLAMCVCLFGTAAMAADEPITLDIADGAIVITATGYSIDGGAETAYTGSYIITGSANTTGPYKTLTVNGVASGSKVTLQDLTILTNGPSALTLNAPVVATGDLILAASAPAISGGSITITGDARLSVKMSGGAPVFSGSTLDLTCQSIDVEAGMFFAGSAANVTTTGDCAIKTTNPCFNASSIAMDIGGALTLESGVNCLVGNTADISAGSISINSNTGVTISTGTASLEASGDITLSSGNSLVFGNQDITVSAGGNAAITAGGSYPVLSATNATVSAAGDVSITATGTNIAISSTNLDLIAGGDLTVQTNGENSLAISGSSDGTQSLKAGGDILVSTASYLAVSGGDVTANGANVTFRTGSSTVPCISAKNLAITATGDVTVTGGNLAINVINETAINAGGNITVASQGSAPTISATKTGLTAGGAVAITNTGDSGAANGNIRVQGSTVTVSTATGPNPVFSGNTSLKATAGDLTVNSTTAESIMFNGENNSLYAAEQILLTSNCPQVSNTPPEMTFGQSITINLAGQEGMFIGLDRVAVEGQMDYLPELELRGAGMDTTDAVFTASLDGQPQTEIKAQGVYNCTVGVSDTFVGLPFNLIVRPAKPAGTPPTGDEAPLAMFGLLALTSAAAMAYICCSRKRYSV